MRFAFGQQCSMRLAYKPVWSRITEEGLESQYPGRMALKPEAKGSSLAATTPDGGFSGYDTSMGERE